MVVTIKVNELEPEDFISLSKKVGWGENRVYDMDQVKRSLDLTNYKLSAFDNEGKVIGCLRAFSDDLLMTFVPDIFVEPKSQGKGVGKALMEKLKEDYGHTLITFGSQTGNEAFFEKLGFEKGLQLYSKRFKESPYFHLKN